MNMLNALIGANRDRRVIATRLFVIGDNLPIYVSPCFHAGNFIAAAGCGDYLFAFACAERRSKRYCVCGWF